MSQQTTEAGVAVFAATDEVEPGTKAPFQVVYKSDRREDRFGYRCTNCDTLNNAMDPMGRLVCNECGNTKRPDEWDAVSG